MPESPDTKVEPHQVRPRPVVPRRGRTRTRREPVAASRWRAPSAALALAIVLAGVVFLHDVNGLYHLRENPVTGTDYLPAAEFIAARHDPGQKILTALPPPTYLSLDSTEDLIFLSSPLDRKRAQRYTRFTTDGTYVDYWTGVDSVVDVRTLCSTLLNEPDLWLLVDRSRLRADWAFAGPMTQVIEGMTYLRYEAEGGAMVRRLAPIPGRDPAAELICDTVLSSPYGTVPLEPEPEAELTPTPTVAPE